MKLNSYIIFLFVGLFFLSPDGSVFAQETEAEHQSGEEPKVKYHFDAWNNWLFASFLKDENDDAFTWGIEVIQSLAIGKVQIKNIAYLEVNRYPRVIPGQPNGNPENIVDTVAADGINDLLTGFWFSKRGHHGKHHFAPGIGFQFPTAADASLGSGKWLIGPSFDYEYEHGRLLAGAIAMNLWSFAGQSDRKDVNMLLVKPFLYYNFSGRWYLMYVPYGVTVYWNKPAGQRAYVPLGGGIRYDIPLRKSHLFLSAQFFNNVVRPDKGTVNDLRFCIEWAF
jgi:hypothetical protein